MGVLVTGGAGYIGSHTVKELVCSGKKVIVLDNLQRGHRQAVKAAELIFGDIADKELVTDILKRYEIEDVIHFAADSLVGESMGDPAKYYHNNVIKTISLLDTMMSQNVKKIVFSSSAAVYGSPSETPITENSLLKPESVYGKTKWMIEEVLKDYERAYGLQYMSLRYFNAAGADMEGLLGEDHSPETHLIPLIFQVALGKRKSMSIYGEDYGTKDGTCIRDYIHVQDLARAHILAMEALRNGKKSNIFNLGSGNGYSVKEIITCIEKTMEKEIPKEVGPRRAGDPDILIASSNKIKQELGWEPKYTLQDIIKSAWKWHENHPNGYEV